MIAQAGIGPGMRVMEIGSGGYNAALLAEVTGEHVVTVDICRTPLIFRAVRGSLEHVLEQAPRTLEQTAEREQPTGSPDEGAARRPSAVNPWLGASGMGSLAESGCRVGCAAG
jgi:hypothetical protein